MAESIKRAFVSQVFTVGQKAAVEYCGNNFLCTVNSMLVEGAPDGVRNSRGLMIPDTGLVFEAAHNSAIKITNQKATTINSSLFKAKEFSFEKLGIGGLDTQFEDIFRRAFSSRARKRPRSSPRTIGFPRRRSRTSASSRYAPRTTPFLPGVPRVSGQIPTIPAPRRFVSCGASPRFAAPETPTR